jgi:hypothetical protein
LRELRKPAVAVARFVLPEGRRSSSSTCTCRIENTAPPTAQSLRVAVARGERLPRDARLVNRLDHWVDLPWSLEPVPIPDVGEDI